MARRLGANEVDAEDVAQEAIARLLSDMPKVERAEGWLPVVVRHLLYRQHRQRASRARLESGLPRNCEEARYPASSWDAEVDMARMLTEISPATRHLIELLLVGCTHREIAAVLGCQVNQVGPRIRRAFETCRRHLIKKRPTHRVLDR